MTALDSTKESSFDCLISQMFDYYNITTELPDSVEPTWTVFAIINSIASPPTTVINFLIIRTILRDNTLKEVPHNILIAALAVTDFLVGLIIEPLYSWYLVALIKRSPIPCHFTVYSFPMMILGCWTINTLMIASVDLYLGIKHTQFYLKHVTTKKLIIATAVVWVTNVICVVGGTLLATSSDSLKKLPIAILMVINIAITLYCTISVHIVGCRQKKAIQAPAKGDQQENRSEDNGHRQQRIQVVIISIMILATFLFYCPYIISAIIQLAKGSNATDDFQYISHPIGATFAHLQSLVNPIFISFRLSYIRNGIVDGLLCRK